MPYKNICRNPSIKLGYIYMTTKAKLNFLTIKQSENLSIPYCLFIGLTSALFINLRKLIQVFSYQACANNLQLKHLCQICLDDILKTIFYAHLVSKAGSVNSNKTPERVFRWSSIYYPESMFTDKLRNTAFTIADDLILIVKSMRVILQ